MNVPPATLTTVAELMSPRSIAVVGASADTRKFGGRILRSLLEHEFEGRVYPINATRAELLGYRAYPSMADVPGGVDLAIMAVPREHVPEMVAQCAGSGVKGIIVVTSKFSDAGQEGAALEAQIVALARGAGARIVGPNCIGIVSPANGFVLCPAPVLHGRRLRPGRIGMVSQSGAIMSTVIDRAASLGIDFSHCVSIGNQADLELCDFVDFMVDDPATDVICSYIEGLKSAHRLEHVAQRAQRAGKPWLMIKSGRTEAGAAAAFSHTASLAGNHAALAAACREFGVLLMDEPESMLLLAAAMAKFPQRKVRSIAVLSPSGGGCTLAADRLSDIGAPLGVFGPETVAALAPMYGEAACNPLDIGAANDGAAMSYTTRSHEIALADPAVDLGLTVITAAPDVARFADMATDGVASSAKPVFMAVTLGPAGDAARELLGRRGVLHAQSLDSVLRAVQGWMQWSDLTRYERPVRPVGLPDHGAPAAGVLSEEAAKEAIAAYGVPVNSGIVAGTADSVRMAAGRLVAPLVVKVVSRDIVHKSDVGGVALGLDGPQAAEEAARRMAASIEARMPHARVEGFLVQEQARGVLELLVGSKYDQQFGPMVMVGAGGIFVELLNDVALARAPVSPDRALALLKELRIARMFGGLRGRPSPDIEAAAEAVSRFSWLVADWGDRLKEFDINPLMLKAAGMGCVAVDARARLESDPVADRPAEMARA